MHTGGGLPLVAGRIINWLVWRSTVGLKKAVRSIWHNFLLTLRCGELLLLLCELLLFEQLIGDRQLAGGI